MHDEYMTRSLPIAKQSTDTYHTPSHVVKALTPFRKRTDVGAWEDVDQLIYKEQGYGAAFKSITRRILFDSNAGQHNQVRYFEVAAGGWSTFEHHEHTHQVIIYRGSGTAIVGYHSFQVSEGDLIFVDSWQWHQFIANDDAALGFICIVTADRDHPVQATPAQLQEIFSQHPELETIIHA